MNKIDMITLIFAISGGILMMYSFYIKNNDSIKVSKVIGRILLGIAILLYILNIIITWK